jgi:CBS domain-containing protein
MKKISNGDRFLAAYNDIEAEFRRALHPDGHPGFMQMARKYTHQRRLPSAYLDELRDFADLRNAISHSRWNGDQPIADPNEATVTEIEQLRDQITSPPTARSVLSDRRVCTASPDDPVSAVLKHVMDFDYSQIPVYHDAHYEGILTTNTVARWAAYWLGRGYQLSGTELVSRVLAFTEPCERVLFASPAITAAEAIDKLTHGGKGRTPVTALLITKDGLESGTPTGIITSIDLLALSAALRTDLTVVSVPPLAESEGSEVSEHQPLHA